MFSTREEWLTEATNFILSEVIGEVAELRDDLKVKISIGFPPNTRATSKVIAVCHPSQHSAGLHNEIFITPQLDCPIRILDVLTHELIHAVDDCQSGHRGAFASIARKVGLEGKLTATVAGPKLLEYLENLNELLGELPHYKLDLHALKKQKSRNHQVQCEQPDCGFKFQASKARIAQALDANNQQIPCICCANPMFFDISIFDEA